MIETGRLDRLPIDVISLRIVPSGSHLLLDHVKIQCRGKPIEETSSMATFFNPYAKKGADATDLVTYIVEGEERLIEIVFSNLAPIPMEIPSCRLEFECGHYFRIDSPPLTFIIPPKTSHYAVMFPFVAVMLSQEIPESVSNRTFSLCGLRLAFSNRSFSVSFAKKNASSYSYKPSSVKQVPDPASVYQRRRLTSQDKNDELFALQFEAVPPQANLLLSCDSSEVPLEDGVTIPIFISDGEIHMAPVLRMKTDNGRTGMGHIDRLQIICVGLSGPGEQLLFDSDDEPRNLQPRISTYFERSTYKNVSGKTSGLPTLKMNCIVRDFSLEALNDSDRSSSGGPTASFVIEAPQDTPNLHSNRITIRFRYRGKPPSSGIELWRKREINLSTVHMKGPKIVSIECRPDLKCNGSYHPFYGRIGLESSKARSENGMVYLCGEKVVTIIEVANETDMSIVLTNRDDRVGGLDESTFSAVKVGPGVNKKIPMVFQRIRHMEKTGIPVNISAELIARTMLDWQYQVDVHNGVIENLASRRGSMQIPYRCLELLEKNHSAFTSAIGIHPLDIYLKLDALDSTVRYPGCITDTLIEIQLLGTQSLVSL